MIFEPLPTGFPRLQAAVAGMNGPDIPVPPPIEAIGLRLRKAYDRAGDDSYRGLSMVEMRKLPYAYWLRGEPSLDELHPRLVERYWNTDLIRAMRSGMRRAKRWLTPLFFTYCDAFSPADKGFRDFARRLATALGQCEGGFAESLQRLDQAVEFFRPDKVSGRLAEALMADPLPIEKSLESYRLGTAFNETRLGNAVFAGALGLGDSRCTELPFVERLMQWERMLGARVVKTDNRIAFADALLGPWAHSNAPSEIRGRLIDFFVTVYGHPGMPGHARYHWAGVSEGATSVLKRWLTGDTLRGFVRVLNETADQTWRWREKFWMAYLKAGHIEEAWLALGADAARIAGKLQSEYRGLGYGALSRGAVSEQSVLLLRIGDLVFSEWSHNGSLRAYDANDERAPRLYRKYYHGGDLRRAISMDFHPGENRNPELRHLHSDTGWWQRKAREFIRRNTGISLADREILL